MSSVSCAKFSAECELVVMPRLMAVQSSPPDGAASQVRVYVYYNVGKDAKRDVLDWAPASYADADAGIITNTLTGEIRSHSLVAGQREEDNFVHLVLTSAPVMLVAVDPVNRFYAWRGLNYEIPLKQLVIPVRFQLWKWQTPYRDTEWTIASEAAEIEDEDEDE